MLLAAVLAVICMLRFHLRNLPLERDEGEYAYAGQLLLQGVPPYKLAYNLKLPGTYCAYALVLLVLGQTPAAVHLGLLLINAATIVLIYLLTCRLSSPIGGLAAATSYALLSVSPSVFGFAGHATHFVVLPALGGLLLLLHAIEKGGLWSFFGSGLLLGMAFVMKQPGVLFVVFGGLYLLSTASERPANWRALSHKIGVFSFGAILPFGITCLILWRAGVFATFWFWTVSYGSQYASNWGMGEGVHLLATMFPAVIGPCVWIWLIAGVGLTAFLWDDEVRRHSLFVLGFLFFSFLAVCPGLLFREHYFILLLPAVSVLTGIGVDAATRAFRTLGPGKPLRQLPTILFALALAASFYSQRGFFFETDDTAACRKLYGGNPFPEAIPIADYIRQHVVDSATVAVLGSEPEIYFYAGRRSATGYIYTYGLMEEQRYALQMQQQMISEIEAARPEVLVFVNVQASWLAQPHSEKLIYAWAQKYIREQYELAGVADIHTFHTDYRWGDDAKTYRPRSNSTVFVFQRRKMA